LRSVEILRRNQLCLTDGDPQMYGTLRAQQLNKEAVRLARSLRVAPIGGKMA